MQSIYEAIEQGLQLAGSVAALATLIGTTRPHVADTRAGRRGLTPYQLAKLANYIGTEPTELLVLDALDREKNPSKREVMRRLFFSGGLLGALVLLCLTTTEAEAKKPLNPTVSPPVIRHIVAHFLRALRMARRGFEALGRLKHAGWRGAPLGIAAAGCLE